MSGEHPRYGFRAEDLVPVDAVLVLIGDTVAVGPDAEPVGTVIAIEGQSVWTSHPKGLGRSGPYNAADLTLVSRTEWRLLMDNATYDGDHDA